jgi:hypothetical protein
LLGWLVQGVCGIILAMFFCHECWWMIGTMPQCFIQCIHWRERHYFAFSGGECGIWTRRVGLLYWVTE